MTCFLKTLLFSAILALTACQSQPKSLATSTDNAELAQMMTDYWETQLQLHPLMANNLGDLRNKDKLTDLSPLGQQRVKRAYDAFATRLAKIEPAQLSNEQRVNYRVFSWILKNERALLDTPWKYYTFDTYSGWHSGFAQEMELSQFTRAQDYRDYIARLAAFSKYGDENIALMKQGLSMGHVQPCATLDGYLDSIRAYQQPAQQNVFYQPFVGMLASLTQSEKNELRQQAQEVIEQVVNPVYERYADFFASHYLPACREDVGISSVPGGAALYDFFVKYYTSTQLDPDQVHNLGLAEVARIRTEMQTIIDDLGFKGDFKAFLQELRENKKYYPKDKQSYLHYAAYLAKKVDGKLPEFFSYLPRTPYGLKEIPAEIAPKTSTAYYQGGAGDGSRAGFYNLNTYGLDSRPLYELPALTLHESVPGHHLQISIQSEMETLPALRRFYYFHAFGEGWGLYAEYLGEEMGMYPSPYDRFGRLTYEMWRACRLVVDSGMHAKGWGRQQAIDYMASNMALSIHNITTEIDRYITWPGQALAYKVGELKIRELRKYAESRLGAKFSLREFHSQVLTRGAVPLSVLQANIEDWVAGQLD